VGKIYPKGVDVSTKGYDLFYTEPDSELEMRCQVCGTICDVVRSVTGPTSMAEAMAKRGHWHDVFSCPHSSEPWHEQALQLVIAIEESPSKRLIALMRQDLEDILREQGL
jgi:hypothetical protein